MKTRSTICCLLVASLLPAAFAAAQTPTFSLEIAAINGSPIPGGTRSSAVASPGDVLLLKLFVRDWSPAGEKLRSYQAALDTTVFSSGASGFIEPVNYGIDGNNDENMFIDMKDPSFIHKDLHVIPVIHSDKSEYTWICVGFDAELTPISKLDGTKKYCGSVRMKVSDTAAGNFVLGLVEDRESTMIIDAQNDPIAGMAFESVTINVPGAEVWARIDSSDPPAGAVDARVSVGARRSRWSTVTLISNGDASTLSASDFTVSDGTKNPPKIVSIRPQGTKLTLSLDRGPVAGRWTTIEHLSSGSQTKIAHLCGDVNNDGVRNMNDVRALIDSLNQQSSTPLYRTDIDASGRVDPRDLVRLIDVIAEGGNTPKRLRE